MSIATGSAGGFKFVEQAVFDSMVAAKTLVSGTFYYTPAVFYLAKTNNTYYTYGGVSVQELADELLSRENFTETLIEIIAGNQTFINTVIQHIVNDASFQNTISVLLLSDTNFYNAVLTAIGGILTRKFISEILADAIAILAPDGSSIATNNNGVFTLKAAANNQFGVVKGQANNTQTTWHNASADNGILSINRGQVESVMDGKDTVIKNNINVRAEDNCIVGRNENGIVILPIRLEENVPVSPAAGTLHLIKET